MSGSISSFGEFINIIKSFQSEDELLDFVNKRYQFLEENNKKRTISMNNNGRMIGTINEGYITSDSSIISSYLVDPFCLDDVNLYTEFVKRIKEKDLSSFENVFYEMQTYTKDIFGLKGNQDIREKIYLKERKGNVSIKDFYNNNSALCSERSATIQNLASFCGINSYLVFGKIIDNDGETKHAYNIFKAKDNTLVLYDATNPVFCTVNDKHSVVPAYIVIGQEDIETLEEVEFDPNYVVSLYNNGVANENEALRQYRTCNYNTNTKGMI